MRGPLFLLRRAVTVVAVAIALAASAGKSLAVAGGRAVEGVDWVRLLPPAGARIDDYRNAGYRMRWVDDEIEVQVDTAPIESDAAFEPPGHPSSDDPVGRLARGLTVGVETRYDAISRILGWVARHVEYDLDRSQPQGARAVLERRSGYCTGVARLTVALLEAVDIPAREVAGYVVGAEPGMPSGFHRWIEAYLPDRGWVFSDPLTTHHYVPATYLRLAAEDLEPARGTEGLMLERRDALTTVDLYPFAAAGVTARRNSDRQLAAALRVRLEDHGRGTAVLEGASARWTHALIDGRTTFVGLDPGSYHLRLLLPGRGVFESPVELPDRVRKALVVTAPALRLDTPRGTGGRGSSTDRGSAGRGVRSPTSKRGSE
ncbi:MAG: transglutaminase domain-containing protein [bacterium]|nr:transglutaminase domain-containing protein [bacterium]